MWSKNGLVTPDAECATHMLRTEIFRTLFNGTKTFMGRAVIVSAFLLFSAPAVSPGQKVVYRDFAIDTCYPTANEIRLAEERARSYWVKNAARFGLNLDFWQSRRARFFRARSRIWVLS